MEAAGGYRRVWSRQNYFEIIVCKKSGDKKQVTKKTEIQLEYILEYMPPDREYKTSEIAAEIGLKKSRARELVNELVKSGRIEAVGKNRGRRYRLK